MGGDLDRPRADDADLVRAARLGDREAFAGLLTRHWAAAVALAARLLGSAEEARDAAQEASIAAMTGLDRLRAADRFGAWYCGITLNVARRWLRRRPGEPAAVPPDLASGEPGPAELAELAELAAAVRVAVTRLPAGQRAAVLLFYLQGLTHREVAAELGISVNAVKARLHQARAALSPGLMPLIITEQTAREALMTPTASSPTWTDVEVTEVRRSEPGESGSARHVMVLAERDGPRRLPIWIGDAEAIAIALSLAAEETPRPLTYQLAGQLLAAAAADVTEVRITRLTEEVFYAAIGVSGPAGSREVDARPSDAVNLALITGAPIRVQSALFDDYTAQDAGRPQWRDYPAGTAELAAQARERMRERARGCR